MSKARKNTEDHSSLAMKGNLTLMNIPFLNNILLKSTEAFVCYALHKINYFLAKP